MSHATSPADPARTVRLRVRRLDPSRDRRPRWQQYETPARPKMSVLDALFAVLEQQDGSLAFRYSCRTQMCGSCAVVINGREGLACGARLDDLPGTVTVEPLRHLPVIKDLVVDMAPFFAAYAAIAPSFHGDGSAEPAVLPPASGAREAVDEHLMCITCGACYSACPTVRRGGYLGPAALNRAYTLIADVRDIDTEERLHTVAGAGGVFSCRNVGNCAAVCPLRLEPLRAIQRLRARMLGG